MNILPRDKQIEVIAALTEGVSVRATERLTGVNRGTILSLALQLRFLFEMGAPGFGLVGAAPLGPGDDVCGLDAPLCQLHGDAADFLDRPADEDRLRVGRRGRVFLSEGTALARWRIIAIIANASMTSETWRCQPCQERLSL